MSLSLWRPFLFALVFVVGTRAFTQSDPGIDWKVLETPHFKIIYNSTQRTMAERYALYAEVAYADLKPVFKEMPDKSTIVVQDDTDASNGFAIGFPYPYSVVYPVTPPARQSVGEYGHWGQELVTHEFTHLLQFEPKHGLMGFLEVIFGSIIVPNGLLPRWWLEGMAVEIESQFSNGGRLRSIRQNATLRALVHSKKLRKEDIARVNESGIPDWLGGSRPYLFGSLIWNEIVDLKGNTSIENLNQRYSSRIPYMNLDTPIHDLTDKDYEEILARVYDKVEKQAQLQIKKIETANPTRSKPIIVEDATSSRPAFSPNKKHLAYIERHINHGTRLKIRSRLKTSKKKIARSLRLENEETISAVQPSNRFSWSPNSKTIVFDQMATHDRYYFFSDIYEYNLANKEVKKITSGTRGREPTYTRNGKSIVFVQLNGDTTRLVQTDRAGKNLKVLYAPPTSYRVSHPEALKNSQLAFTERDTQGNESLKILDLGSLQARKILADFEPIYRPRYTSAGLMFISGKTGVYNAYLASRDLKTARALTNSKTSIFDVDWDRYAKELVVTELTGNGPAVATIRGRKKKSPPVIDAVVPYQRKKYEPSVKSVTVKEGDYSPWGYLLPRHWMPYVVLSENGLFFQATTSSHDPVGRHQYSLLAAYDTSTEKLNAAASYTNSTTRVPVTIGGFQYHDFFGGSSVLRKTTSGSLTTSGFIYGLSNHWKWSLGWDYLETDVSTNPTRQQGPFGSLRYKSVKKRGKQIAPESGGDMLLSVTNYIESLGTVGYVSTKLNGSAHWAPSWYFDHHVFSLKWRSVYSPNNNNFFNGESTAGATYQTSLITSQLLMRGYLGGNFVARTAINPTLEYSFPLFRDDGGWGLLPFFSRNWSAKLFADAISLDGVFFDESANAFRSTSMGTFYYGVGGQLHWSTTVGYHAPIEFFLGLYYGANDEASGGFRSFLGISL